MDIIPSERTPPLTLVRVEHYAIIPTCMDSVTKLATFCYFLPFLAGDDSESVKYIDIRLRRTRIQLARYRSPGKNRHLDENKWI